MRAAPAFQPLGTDHVAALLLTALLAAAACRVVRRDRDGWPACTLAPLLALLLLAAIAGWAGGELRAGRLAPWQLLPLHLCDLLVLVAAAALLSRRLWLYELLYFWAGAGALLAMLTPDVPRGFPDPYFLLFFGLHGAVVLAAALLTWGYGLRPRPGAWWRVFGWTLLYAALVAVVNAFLGTNFLFLRGKPSNPTLLDWLGPWPWYLLAAALLALVLFRLLEQPFRARPFAGGQAAGRMTG